MSCKKLIYSSFMWKTAKIYIAFKTRNKSSSIYTNSIILCLQTNNIFITYVCLYVHAKNILRINIESMFFNV